jgi:hypothetical protein
MPQCKITVLKKLLHEDLAKEYCFKETVIIYFCIQGLLAIQG